MVKFSKWIDCSLSKSPPEKYQTLLTKNWYTNLYWPLVVKSGTTACCRNILEIKLNVNHLFYTEPVAAKIDVSFSTPIFKMYYFPWHFTQIVHFTWIVLLIFSLSSCYLSIHGPISLKFSNQRSFTHSVTAIAVTSFG